MNLKNELSYSKVFKDILLQEILVLLFKVISLTNRNYSSIEYLYLIALNLDVIESKQWENITKNIDYQVEYINKVIN